MNANIFPLRHIPNQTVLLPHFFAKLDKLKQKQEKPR